MSIPSTTLASGDRLSFSVSFDTAKLPLLSQVSDKNIHVALVNKVSLWSSSSSKIVSSERQIAYGSVQCKDESQGSLLFQGSIQAGCAGKENSWCLDDVLSVEVNHSLFFAPGLRSDFDFSSSTFSAFVSLYQSILVVNSPPFDMILSSH